MSAFFVPLQTGGFYLSAGDATAQDEIRIGTWAALQARTALVGPRILKISHHGSKTSSNPQFLKLIAPTETWISVGVGNTYGHPSAVVLDRIARTGIPVHRSDEEGAMSSNSPIF
jgi:competence protein ComEC